MLKRSLFILLSFIVSLSLAQDPKMGGILTWGLSTDPPNLDPHVSSGASAATVKMSVYNGLVRYDKDGQIVPDLATDWQISEDGLTYTFNLRDGVMFHDGTPLSSADVKFSLERIINPDTGAYLASAFGVIESIDTPDDLTVVLHLSEPHAALLPYLARQEAEVVSKAFVEGGGDLNLEMMGTGPFMFVSREPDVSIKLEKNPNYYETGKPYLDGITFIPYADEQTRVTALEAGDIDLIEYVPWKDMEAIEQNPDLELHADEGAAFMTLIFNQERKPFDDPLVRKAFGYAIPRDAIIRVAFFDRGSPITGGLIPPNSPYHNDELDGTYSYDPEKALSILAEAGWTDSDGDGILDKDGETLSVSLLSTSTYGMHMQTAQVVDQALREIGVDITLELEEWSVVVARQTESDFDFRVHGLGVLVEDPDFLAGYFMPDAFYAKISHMSDEMYGEPLTVGRTSTSEEERKAAYLEFEKAFLDQAPWVHLTWRTQGEATQSYVKGYSHLPGPLWGHSAYTLKETWLDK
ncbi:MAG: hypothetical protein KC422_06495 [Trueperaceae bacterium]|nr:hypothetical protein [Trueperaceae bacterium]